MILCRPCRRWQFLYNGNIEVPPAVGISSEYGAVCAQCAGDEQLQPLPGPEPLNGEETMEPNQQEHILQFFTYEHLRSPLREVSEPFARLAHDIVATLPRNPERTAALRKLLEAKDAAVRAMAAKP